MWIVVWLISIFILEIVPGERVLMTKAYDCSAPDGCREKLTLWGRDYPYLSRKELTLTSKEYVQTIMHHKDLGIFTWVFDIRVSGETPIDEVAYWYSPLKFCICSNTTRSHACYPIGKSRTIFREMNQTVMDPLDFKLVYGINIADAMIFNRSLMRRNGVVRVQIPKVLEVSVLTSFVRQREFPSPI